MAYDGSNAMCYLKKFNQIVVDLSIIGLMRDCLDISGIEDKVISLYARGMTTRDIGEELKELYGINVSAEKVSKITDRILPDIKEWQSRPFASDFKAIYNAPSE